MLFNSSTFIFLHFIVFVSYWLAPKQWMRIIILTIGSLIFYGWFYWPGIFFIASAIGINYFLGIKIEQTRSSNWLGFAIILNLLNLIYFKYVHFIAQSWSDFFNLLGLHLDFPIPSPSYWLPLGISFITFQKIAYLVDVYKQKTHAEKNILVFTCFAAFYGQLIAGPIVRSEEFFPQIRHKRTFSLAQVQLGFFYFIMGLMIKVTVADTLAQFVDFGFSNISQLDLKSSWLTLYAFAIQILCDFWGYSTMALGCAYMLGIKLPINFNLPYSSTSLTEFWKRWHITLGSWLRDYLYIPLGGNKTGKTYRNLILTMTLGGLWHGANWTFFLWGMLNGLWLALERLFGIKDSHHGFLLGLFKKILTFHGVCVLWVLFRSKTLNEAIAYYKVLFLPPYRLDSNPPGALTTLLILFILFYNLIGKYLIDERFLRLSIFKQLVYTIFAIMLILAYSQAKLNFIYFNF